MGPNPKAWAHALPVRSDPAPNAALRTPPAQVRIWFDDALVSATSHISIQGPLGHEVDRRENHLRRSNPREMSVTLPKLPAGTYTVLWVAQSADDGHIAEGSFVFSVTLPDGTDPAAAHGLFPRQQFEHSEQRGARWANARTGACYLAGVARDDVLADGLIWETWVLTPGASDDPDLARASLKASRRFHRLVPYALGAVIFADVAMVLGQAAALSGGCPARLNPPRSSPSSSAVTLASSGGCAMALS